MKQKVNCTWHLNRDCNFRCSYCYVSKQRDLSNQRGHGVDIDISAFKQNKIHWNSILMTGGEPFIYPDYVELCKKLIGICNIDINTNCSTSNVFDFAEQINPKKVGEFHISLHIGQRPKKQWDKLVEKINYLQQKKFNVKVTEVYHPSLIKQYEEAYKYFSRHNVFVIPKVFEGYYKLKVYPRMYTEDMRNSFIEYCIKCKAKNEVTPGLYGTLSWKDKPCVAGYSFMQIQYNGNAYRCQTDTDCLLGNLYKHDIKTMDDVKLCGMPTCRCMYEGLNYAQGKPKIQQTSLKEYSMEAGMYYMDKIRKVIGL